MWVEGAFKVICFFHPVIFDAANVSSVCSHFSKNTDLVVHDAYQPLLAHFKALHRRITISIFHLLSFAATTMLDRVRD